jgi:replicative DNA helicase
LKGEPRNTEFDRLPPSSVEAELALLGSVVLDRAMLEDVRASISHDSFYSADNQIIWDVVDDLYKRGSAIDMLIVREELEKRQLLQEVGGVAYLGRVFQSMPSAAHGMHYAGIVAEKAKLREIIATSTKAIRDAYAPADDDVADEIARELERGASRIREFGFAESINSIGQIVAAVLETKRQKVVTRYSTGLHDLDDVTQGLPVGGLTYIGGLAGMGKSQLLKQILMNTARSGMPAGFVSVEEPNLKIGENMLANTSGIENKRIVNNKIAPSEWDRLAKACEELRPVPLFVDDSRRTISSIETTIRRMVRKHGCRMIGVDHLHLIDGETNAQREQEIAAISGGLKAIFKELGVAGIVALQLNRGGAQDGDGGKPELRHLRGSGTLEQDGDLIIQLYRDDYFRWKKEGESFTPNHELLAYVNKNKGGEHGHAKLYFDGDHQAIRDWEEQGDGGDPELPNFS